MERTPSGTPTPEAFDRAVEDGMPYRVLLASFEPGLGNVYQPLWQIPSRRLVRGKRIGVTHRRSDGRLVFVKGVVDPTDRELLRNTALFLWRYLRNHVGVPQMLDYVVFTDCEALVTEGVDGADLLEWAICCGVLVYESRQDPYLAEADLVTASAASMLLGAASLPRSSRTDGMFTFDVSPRSRLVERLEQCDAAAYIPEAYAISVFARLADILLCAHRAGVAHRDVKAENVLIGMDGEVSLADWEFACSPAHATRCLGTLGYAPPEVLEDASVDACAEDVWALGVVFYACLVGALPFGSASYGGDAILAAQHAHARCMERRTPGVAFPDDRPISRLATETIRRMLTLQPAGRPTMADVRDGEWLRGVPVVPRLPVVAVRVRPLRPGAKPSPRHEKEQSGIRLFFARLREAVRGSRTPARIMRE